MGFTFQPYLSRGTATPAVARTTQQTHDLVQGYGLPADQTEQLNGIGHDVMLKLLACLDEAEPVIEQVQDGQAQIDKGLSGNAATAIQLPAVVDLRKHAEGFLWNVKAALREIARLFGPFYCKQFDHRFQHIRKWAEETFGPDDRLVKALNADAPWIEKVISMRNAVDHPGTGDGTLVVENFRVVKPGPPVVVLEPVWHKKGDNPQSIAYEMDVIQENLLTLYEDLLREGLERLKGDKHPFVIYEVPEAERDPAVPVRFRLGLRPGISLPGLTGQASG